ncbi:uncharacterized protein LOC130612464 [Hydractinia symbiolongicarpus]|uniref:uncharacterized protein LOC130612464 n=1 Tax=Hydractinia symbiolongicarpus TaxID=13093 RepID=UPI00254E85B9|nr:uncharacterized protein LOC130612464 [Hydractinia symbiolongicarpus]
MNNYLISEEEEEKEEEEEEEEEDFVPNISKSPKCTSIYPTRKISLFHAEHYKRDKSDEDFQIVHSDQPQMKEDEYEQVFEENGWSLKKKAQHQTKNTYVTKPSSQPSIPETRSMIKKICHEFISFDNIKYTMELPNLIITISDKIKNGVKSLGKHDRYRVIVTTEYLEGKEFYGKYVSGFLWNSETDLYVDYKYKLRSGYVIFTVYYIYME